MKVKTPPSYILWFIVLLVIGVVIIVPWMLDIFGIVDFDEIFIWVMGTLIGWTVIIVLALIGAIFVGMLLSHRILSIGAFTPFEEEMLKMSEDIKAIKKKLDKMDKDRKEDTQ
jgi:uncharacterized membrane protein (UPF0182 family)